MLRGPGFILCLMALSCTILPVSQGANQCLVDLEEITPKRIVQEEGKSLNITIELSGRITQRLISRIMKIFLVEVLGYESVSLVENDDQFDSTTVYERLSHSSVDEDSSIPEIMVNMEVWIPGLKDTTEFTELYRVKECGTVGPGGYFGWFVPRELWPSNMTETWQIFSSQNTVSQFDVDEETMRLIKSKTIKQDSKNSINQRYYCSENFCKEGTFVPKQCENSTPCAMLLASEPEVTNFVINYIIDHELYVKVAWVGKSLKNLTREITNNYKFSNKHKSLVILHWTPSEIVPNDTNFISIGFPRSIMNTDIYSKYDNYKMIKLVWSRLENIATIAYKAIKRTSLTSSMYQDLISRYNNQGLKSNEDTIACDWLKQNLNYTLKKWKPGGGDKKILYIGGIFPMSGNSFVDESISSASLMARDAINRDNTILRDYKLQVWNSDGQCTSDMVMKSFIDYLIHSQKEALIGILGPACSETVEPLIGVSKQYRTMVISYGAEGSSFDDREKYPYFFRTIGENIHYKDVYLSLLKHMKWSRVAALAEDGQKYTEYISHMQYHLQENGINFIDNAKYPGKKEPDVIFQYLENLKKKRARIIIADVDDDVARQVMCDAYKLKMTAYEGYVWFLPLWLSPDWWDTELHNNKSGESVLCTTSEMIIAINGYFGISHANYASDDSIMQENKTVREWRNAYESICKTNGLSLSDYAGYAYDATWTYAYAIDKLLSENGSYVFALQRPSTANRLTEIISKTDFFGVSGRIKFLNGASRISSVQILQHVNNETNKIAIFHPNVSEYNNEVDGGILDINTSAIVWLTSDGKIPDDGSEPELKCFFSSLAQLLDVTCEVAILVVNIIGFTCVGILVIVAIIIVKRKYNEKVRLQEKYLKSLGIDLLQTDTSGLDKWEIPRECVVINRKLGEGAFGTVYGGEAFFTEKGWLAVAVKTLKVGSSTEEKLDFLSEVEVMKRFEHKNIIKLLGVCIKCEPVYTVMEFMLYGDLKTYLLARRHLVNDRNYEDYDEISSKKLTAMALDVARALSYLAQLKYVHRDIASRNCLVNAQRVVKLGDFGMTRPMYENDYYKFNRKGMLPVRWMAPESLGLGIFTPASDVWSYGVLLYEIITFGSFPFQGLSNNEVLEHVKSGNTINIPSGIKAPLENLIRSCWRIDHKLRVKAPEIVDILATNPRLLSPYLDVPLASVQLEHTGQIDMQLPEKFRKISISMSKSNNNKSTNNHLRNNKSNNKLTPINNGDNMNSEIPFLGEGINKEDIDSCNDELLESDFINARLSYLSTGGGSSSNRNADSSIPLLRIDDNDESIIINHDSDDIDKEISKYVKLERNVDRISNDKNADSSNEFSARYVNMQPGGIHTAITHDNQIIGDNVIVNLDENQSTNPENIDQYQDSENDQLNRRSFL